MPIITNRCLIPLIKLCEGQKRLELGLSFCNPCEGRDVTLTLTKQGCPEYQEICVEEPINTGCGCPAIINLPRVKVVEKPKPQITYPMLEIDASGKAVFVLDSKLDTAGFGRYRAVVSGGSCGEVVFDIEYTCQTNLTSISVDGGICAY